MIETKNRLEVVTMNLNELNTTQAEQLGILPAYCRAQKLLKLKAIVDAEPFDQSLAEQAQQEFIAESADAREGLGPAWDRVVLAITLGWDIPDNIIASLATACANNARNAPKLFSE